MGIRMVGHYQPSAAVAARPASPETADAADRFATFLLFSDDRGLDEEPILAAVRQRLAAAGAEVTVDPSTERRMASRATVGVFRRTRERVPLALAAAGARLAITVDPGGGAAADWSGFRDDGDWPEAAEAMARAKAHVAIREAPEDAGAAGTDAAYNRALAVSLAADAVAGLRPPLAVLWHPAGHAVPPAAFARAMADLARFRAPLRLWLALRHGGATVRSEGLRLLAGREVEAEPSPFGALATERMVLYMAHFLVGRRGRAEAGAVVEGPRGSRIRVEDGRGEAGEPLWRLRTLAD